MSEKAHKNRPNEHHRRTRSKIAILGDEAKRTYVRIAFEVYRFIK